MRASVARSSVWRSAVRCDAAPKSSPLIRATHALTLTAEQWLHPDPGKEADLLKTLLTRVKSKGKSQDDDLGRAADILTTGASPVVLLGSEFLQMDESADVLACR